LTEAVRRAPHSVVLLDELEKAHPDVLNILLQIMEDGILTDGKGRTVNFKNTILIMTSNVGSQRIMAMTKLEAAAHRDEQLNGGRDSEQEVAEALYAKLSEVVKDELEMTMRPELLNRMDEIVVFSPLSNTDLNSIAGLILTKTVERASSEQELTLKVTPAFSQKVTEEGSSNAAQFGARPMRRAAQRFFEDAVSDAIVRGFLKRGDDAVVDLASENEDSRQYVVEIRRSSDGKVLEVPIEKVSGGIGASTSDSSSTSELADAGETRKKKVRNIPEVALDTEPVS
jgi:ATP-dependent Clp protease ATP-binding subunit ClpC